MRAIMLTIRLKWFYLTYKGIKTIEVRKSAPKDFVGDVFEVVSKTNFEKDLMEIPENEREFFKQFKGKVGLKFTLNKVEEIGMWNFSEYGTRTLLEPHLCIKSCLDCLELKNYLKGKGGYAWHISNLVIFDEPIDLWKFEKKVHYTKCETCPFNVGSKMPYCATCEFLIPLKQAPQSYCFIEVK